MSVVGFDKFLDLKIVWDGSEKFDVLYQRHTDEWVVVDSFLRDINDSDEAKNEAYHYLRVVQQEIIAA
jgi:hypothetical protein